MELPIGGELRVRVILNWQVAAYVCANPVTVVVKGVFLALRAG